MELFKKKIVFLGDSITLGCGTTSKDHIFWNVVARETGAVCVGYGVKGSRIAPQPDDNTERADRPPFGVRAAAMEPDADVIVVMGGTNDYGHGNAPFGEFSDRDLTTFYGALHSLILQLIEQYPSAQLVFMTPPHRAKDYKLGINQFGVRRAANLEGYVNAIQKVTAYYGIPTLDLYRTSGLQPDVPLLRERYMPDGTHPNDAGHRRIADRLIGFLKAL